MQKENKTEKINVYRVGRLSILKIMGILAVLGLVTEWGLRYLFT